ncbi:MAG: cation-translocating P-type ATPase [Phycisphaerales bacterium]|nr:cation-translocating P-type ATPase [Phycisphaerales bacterium]
MSASHSDARPQRRPPSLISRLFSEDWQLGVAVAAGSFLLVGYTLHEFAREAENPRAHLAADVLMAVSLGFGAIHGVKAAVEALSRWQPNIDVLMVVGAFLAASIGHVSEGALLLFLFTLAQALEHRALARAKDAVSRLHKLMPHEALVKAGEHWVEVRPEDLKAGQTVLVRPGETVPCDGIVASGRSALDQSALTGESLPRNVSERDEVFAGTINQQGVLEVRVTRPVGESSLNRIMQLVIEAQETRQPMQRLIDRLSTPYTLAVFAAAAGALLWFRFGAGKDWSQAVYQSITLLIVASPCALVIATPTATLCGLNRAARAGLLVKGGDSLERLAGVSAVALDKTGTLTTGRIEVTSAAPVDGSNGERLLRIARAVEERSTHPIAAAVVRYCAARNLNPVPVEGITNVPGRGVEASAGGDAVRIGSLEFAGEILDEGRRRQAAALIGGLRDSGAITTVISSGGGALVLGLADTPRPNADRLAEDLRSVGVGRLVMLTGDHKVIAEKMARDLGLTEVHAELLPEGKVAMIREIRSSLPGGRGLAVIGDGVNDAPALALADVGLAMGGIGADAALESADVIVLHDDLNRVPWSIRLARRVRSVMLGNLAFALSVIVLLALGALLGYVPMGLGVLGHEGSTLVVVAVSLTILAFPSPDNGAGARGVTA